MGMTAQDQQIVPHVIPVNVPGFPFPSSTFFNDQLPKVMAGSADVNEAQALVQSFFKRISVFFPTHASDQALETQAIAVLNRITEKQTASRMTAIMSAASSMGKTASGPSAKPTQSMFTNAPL